MAKDSAMGKGSLSLELAPEVDSDGLRELSDKVQRLGALLNQASSIIDELSEERITVTIRLARR